MKRIVLVLKKYFTRSLRSLVKYFSTLEEKFRISARPCNILYLFSPKANTRLANAGRPDQFSGKENSVINQDCPARSCFF